MRIAEIAPVWTTVPPQGYGGIELVVSHLTENLVRRGHDVTLFASGGSATTGTLCSPFAEPPGIGVEDGPAKDLYHATSAFLRAEEFDVIHDHSSVGPWLGAAVDGVVVHTLHGPWTPWVRRQFALVDGRIHVVAISHAQAAENDDVCYAGVVPNGIDLDAYPLNRDKDDFLLFVGRANRDKGPELAVEVAKRVGMRLVMVVKTMEPHEEAHWRGQVEPRLTGTEEILSEVSHEAKVDLMGRARALVFPIQWSEPFGLVMAEAMACGTPVIATPRGAATEVVSDGHTGWLCAGVDEMVSAIDRLDVISPDDCRARVKEKFSAESMTDGYERLFERLLTRPLPRLCDNPVPREVSALADGGWFDRGNAANSDHRSPRNAAPGGRARHLERRGSPGSAGTGVGE
jgi:glycosyltransferase involved in cell wall biosynthesis